MLIALVAIPFILRGASVERLDFVTISWAAIGHPGFLDFGPSRAIVRRIAAAHDADSLSAETALMPNFGRPLFLVAVVLAALVFALVPAEWIFRKGSGQLPAGELGPAWVVRLGMWTHGVPIVALPWANSIAWLVAAAVRGVSCWVAAGEWVQDLSNTAKAEDRVTGASQTERKQVGAVEKLAN